jgi:hypothetical protein
MHIPRSLLAAIIASVIGAGTPFVSRADASTIPYSNLGQVNLQSYSLVANESGDINVWFAGKGTATHQDLLTAFVNGASTGIVGLDNQTSTIGQYLNFGHVNTGDTIVFQLIDLSSGANWFTNNAQNEDGVNHAYMTTFAGGLVGSSVVPAAIYLGFEDVVACASDLNYQDLQFYMSTGSTGAVPEPSTWAMMILGFAGVAFTAYRRRTGTRHTLPRAR